MAQLCAALNIWSDAPGAISVLDSIRATMIDAPQNTRGFICVFIRFPLIYVKAKISRAGGCSADHP